MKKKMLTAVLSVAAAMFALTGPASIGAWLPSTSSVQASTVQDDGWDW